ncbi:MAG: glutaredoxin 3 [Desulfosudaceae bacterium]
MKHVTVYASTTCPFCLMAEQLLDEKQARPEIRLIDEHPEYIAEVVEKSGGRRTVPQIFIGDYHVGGYDELAALEKAGKLDDLLRS